MHPTIYDLLKALLAPADRLAALSGLAPATDASGCPRLGRTSRFAESEVVWQQRRWLLCMPLVPAALPSAERAAARLRSLRSPWLAEYRLLRGALRYGDSAGTEHGSDIVLQQLPGVPFAEALGCVARDRLDGALDALRGELRRLGIAHGNLKEENLRWHDGRLVPVRWHDMRIGSGADDAAFEALHRCIGSKAPEQEATASGDIRAERDTPDDPLTGHLWVGHPFEQLVCVADAEGFGFVDTSNRTVIPARYLWAGDFHEGRAAVQTAEGMGLIDKQGRHILPPRFEIVTYSPGRNVVYVRDGGAWSLYDYEGRLLGPAPGPPDE